MKRIEIALRDLTSKVLLMSAEFVHLRLHTEYSLIDSVVRVPELADAVRAAGHARRRRDRPEQPLRDGEVSTAPHSRRA